MLWKSGRGSSLVLLPVCTTLVAIVALKASLLYREKLGCIDPRDITKKPWDNSGEVLGHKNVDVAAGLILLENYVTGILHG